MLWNASAINGYAIKASDGVIGTVADLKFQGADWTINWLEIETGGWLFGRRILIPTVALGQPDPEARQFHVNLTMRQIEEGPHPDTGERLSAVLEARLLEHYGLPPGVGGGGAGPEGNRDHLNSIAAVTGNPVEATDGNIGHAADFLIDTSTWQVRYLTIDTSDWWEAGSVVISPGSITSIDWAEGGIHLGVTRQKVRDSPPYVAAETVDGAYDETFQTYYGIRWTKR